MKKSTILAMFLLICIPLICSTVIVKKHDSINETTLPKPYKNDSKVIVWSGKFFLNSDIFIRNGQTLKILPGTKVIARQNYGIYLEEGAILKARGEKGKEIIFTANFDDDNRYGEYHSDFRNENWKGIKFSTGGEGYNHLRYCIFSDCNSPLPDAKRRDNFIYNPLIMIESNSSVFFENCTFQDCNYKGAMIETKSGRMTFRDSKFTNCEAEISTWKNYSKFENCSFIDNEKLSFNLYNGFSFFNDCVFSFCNDMEIVSKFQKTFLMDKCCISDCVGKKKLLQISKCNSSKIAESTIDLGKDDDSNIGIYGSQILVERCLIIANHESSIYINNTKGLTFSGMGKNRSAFINTEFRSNCNNFITLGENIDFYIINSIMPDKLTSIFMEDFSNKTKITAYNNLLPYGFPIANEADNLEKDLSSNLYFMAFDPGQHGDLYKGMDLLDKGISEFDNGVFNFHYSKKDYRGYAPDIGRIEK